MEIERKFLVNNIDSIDLTKFESQYIVQDYLYIDALTAIRKRKIIKNGDITYKYTIKTDKIGLSANEFEIFINEKQYDELITDKRFNCIRKTRYIVPYINNLKIELDVFDDNYGGIIFAEIEFENDEQAMNTNLPEWFGKELSNKVTNSDMAQKPVDEMHRIINKINSL